MPNNVNLAIFFIVEVKYLITLENIYSELLECFQWNDKEFDINDVKEELLRLIKSENSDKLKEYLDEIQIGDITNREGHAAKVYFNSLFGNGFYRDDPHNVINKYLNYGYSIIVSLISREIKVFGYLTEVGIHHKGETNSFNLTYDFFEPLRTYVDYFVVKNLVNEDNYKSFFIKILENKVYFDGKVMYLDNAIHCYVQSLFSALISNDIEKAKFIEYEL